MRSIAVALVLAAALVALIALQQLDASRLWVAPAMVIIGVAAACVATGGVTWLAVVFGSLGALAFGWLSGWNPTVALVATSAGLLAARGFLAPSQRDLVVFATAAVPAAIVAGLVAAHFAAAPLAQHLAACVFAGAALAVSHVVVRVDDPMTHGLDLAGKAIDGESGEALLQLVQARRVHAQSGSETAGPRERWAELLRKADALAALRGSSGAEADSKRAHLDREVTRTARDLLATVSVKDTTKQEPEAKVEAAEPAQPPAEAAPEDPAPPVHVAKTVPMESPAEGAPKAVEASPSFGALVP
jgi:hypothetical protein